MKKTRSIDSGSEERDISSTVDDLTNLPMVSAVVSAQAVLRHIWTPLLWTMTVICFVCVPESFGQELPAGMSGSMTATGNFSYGYHSRNPLSSVSRQHFQGPLEEYPTSAIPSYGYDHKHLWVGSGQGEWAQINLLAPTQELYLWGERYLHGTDEIGRNVEVGRHLLKRAADMGYAPAQRNLAGTYRYGVGGRQDFAEAERLYGLAVDQGDVQAMLDLAEMLAEDGGARQNHGRRKALLAEAANSGDPQGQVLFGMLLQAQGDDNEAFKWYSRAAEQQDPDGIVRLGIAHRDGIGTNRDINRARQLFTQASRKRDPAAQTHLAQMLLRGEGGPADLTRALELLELAWGRGHAPAAFRLAQLYSAGTPGTPRDPKMAYELNRGAGELGYEEAFQEDGELLEDYCKSTATECVTINIMYLTDRQDTGKERLDFRFANRRQNPSAVTDLHYGLVQVTVPVAQNEGNFIQNIAAFFGYGPSKIIRAIRPLSKEDFGKRIRNLQSNMPNPRILLFVHGFNSSFSFAARRFAEFASRIGFKGIPLMFSWPSSNKWQSYVADYDQAKQSCPRLTYGLDVVHQYMPNAQIEALVHSMGAVLLFENLTAGSGGRCEATKTTFSNIVLAAPDIKTAIFSEHFELFRKKARQVTLYASSKDTAMYLSSDVVRPETEMRLGEGGTNLTVLQNMHSLDASGIEQGYFNPFRYTLGGDPAGHAYVFVNDTVVQDVMELLMLNKQPDNRSCLDQHWSTDRIPYWTFKAQCNSLPRPL